MTFEEDFPSLKDAELINDGDEEGYTWKRREKDNWTDAVDTQEPVFLKSNIEKHCFDKQKVRDLILKMQNKRREGCMTISKRICGDELLKELGL